MQWFFKAKHGIGAVQIGTHGFYALLSQGIVPFLLFRGFPGREHILINFQHAVGVGELRSHGLYALPIVCNGVLRKRPHHILRRVHEKVDDLTGQPPLFVFRHGGAVGIGEKLVLGDQLPNALGRLRPFQRDLGIGRTNTAVTEFDALSAGAGEVVVSGVAAAVFTVIILEVFFALGLIFVGSIKGVHTETIVGAVIAAAQHLVHLIGGNKKLPVGSKPVGNGKMKRLPL